MQIGISPDLDPLWGPRMELLRRLVKSERVTYLTVGSTAVSHLLDYSRGNPSRGTYGAPSKGFQPLRVDLSLLSSQMGFDERPDPL